LLFSFFARTASSFLFSDSLLASSFSSRGADSVDEALRAEKLPTHRRFREVGL
jgi:hypothetical protein